MEMLRWLQSLCHLLREKRRRMQTMMISLETTMMMMRPYQQPCRRLARRPMTMSRKMKMTTTMTSDPATEGGERQSRESLSAGDEHTVNAITDLSLALTAPNHLHAATQMLIRAQRCRPSKTMRPSKQMATMMAHQKQLASPSSTQRTANPWAKRWTDVPPPPLLPG